MQSLLTAPQTRGVLNISNPTLDRLNDQGTLPAIASAKRQRKRMLRWRRETMEWWITSRKQHTQ